MPLIFSAEDDVNLRRRTELFLDVVRQWKHYHKDDGLAPFPTR